MTIPPPPSEAPPGVFIDVARPARLRAIPPQRPPGSSPDGPVGVVHVVAEYTPYAHTGGLADAVAGLASQQASAGVPTAVIVPLHRSVRRAARELLPAGRPFPVEVGPRVEWARLFRVPTSPGTPRVFFIEHDGYFNRPGPYGSGGQDYGDNGLRFAFFARAALAVVPRIASAPVIVHAHDWHAALVPVYLRTRFAGHPFYDRARSVLTIHNAAFQGHFPEEMLSVVGLPRWLYDWRLLEWYGRVNYLKGGMAFADFVTTVSPTHARELMTPEGGFGLHDAFISLGDRMLGIVNGIDTTRWNPATDPHLTANYSPDDLSGKRRCKAALQRTFGLPQRYNAPLVAMAARLVAQKGLDLLIDNAALFASGAQFAFTGRGDAHYEGALTAIAARSHQRVGVRLGFSDRMARRMMSGADIFLVPSLYEPCGLTQMTSQRYGTLPVARRVGGLADTIEDGQTGFLFDAYTPEALTETVQLAVETYASPARWAWLVEHAIEREFGWEHSASEYAAVYRRVLAAAAVGQ
jgi:starch synthase